MGAGKVVTLILGSVILLLGIAMLFGGGALVGVDLGFTDDEGFLTTPPAELERATYAVVGEAVFEGEWVWWYRHPTTARIRMTSDRPVFLGIAPRDDLEAYLSDISYSEIERIDFNTYRGRRLWATEYDDVLGSSAPTRPAEQTFWVAQAEGEGVQTLTWTLEPGEWMLVVMNADGSPGVEASGTVGIEAPWLLAVGIGLLAAGVVILAIGLALVLIAARSSRTATADRSEPAEPESPGRFPMTFVAELTEPLSPALWLVKWFLLIPHFVVLAFLWCGFAVSWLVALFTILFTGRYPRGLFEYNVGVLRWSWRVAFYSYDALATDRYPPFTLHAGGYPADLDVAYPDRLSPGLALVKWWLLAIPHYIVLGVIQGGSGFYQFGLTFILTIFSGVTLLFTGRYPHELFRLIVGLNRWTFRVLAYAALMTDVYPPFRLEE